MPRLLHGPGKGVKSTAPSREKKLQACSATVTKAADRHPCRFIPCTWLLLQSNSEHVVGTVVLKLTVIGSSYTKCAEAMSSHIRCSIH